ncbi:hypothetical protein fugu_012935 [Takifugu bimaculatus]|uniref:Uncharacterized protein n=1 Tax=Takifugu bimaculatus TaxID=433685 RepID=A0A4Z2C6Q2_9TELE|nr:hypothetical protein fugu_012935 [Takifugu bimaculatus]
MNAEKILGSAVPTPSATTSPGRSAASVKMDISLAVMGGPARLSLALWTPVKKERTPATSKSALSAPTPEAPPTAAPVCQVSAATGEPAKTSMSARLADAIRRLRATTTRDPLGASADRVITAMASSAPQRGRKHGVRLTETACWPSRSMGRRARVLPLVSTSPCVTRAAPMSPCSATAAPDTAGAWTETDRRSLGPARSPAADPCVLTMVEWRRPLVPPLAPTCTPCLREHTCCSPRAAGSSTSPWTGTLCRRMALRLCSISPRRWSSAWPMTAWRKWSTGPKSRLPPSARPASRGEIQSQLSDQTWAAQRASPSITSVGPSSGRTL